MTLKPKKRILAIDYGHVRVGIAISDPLGIFSYPLVTLKNDNNLIKSILKIIEEYEIEKIILGYPLKENGEKSTSTQLVDKFKLKFESKTNIPVILFDERYSSAIAKEKILESVKSKKKRKNKELIDKYAAAVILEDFLNEQN